MLIIWLIEYYYIPYWQDNKYGDVPNFVVNLMELCSVNYYFITTTTTTTTIQHLKSTGNSVLVSYEYEYGVQSRTKIHRTKNSLINRTKEDKLAEIKQKCL